MDPGSPPPPARPPGVRVLADPPAVAREAARELLAALAATPAGQPFTVALSGGSTPRLLFRELAAMAEDPGLSGQPHPGSHASRQPIPWHRLHWFWGDERPVPPDHPDSNFRLAESELLAKLAPPPGNVHRIEAELGAAEAAARYEAELRSFFQLAPGGRPRFDLVFLGLGGDGHTASLFPGTEALGETSRLVAAPWVEKLGQRRITLTYPVLNAARRVLFLVTGADKAATLARVLAPPRQPEELPAQGVQPTAGELLWLIDRAAAG
jgi:6-phosphogluconolactonase